MSSPGTRTPHPLRYVRKGFHDPLPSGVALVARNSRFGNPFRVERLRPGPDGWGVTHQPKRPGPVWTIADGLTAREANVEAVEQYREWLKHTEPGREILADARENLRGMKLACYCPLEFPCHADVLAELINPDPQTQIALGMEAQTQSDLGLEAQIQSDARDRFQSREPGS